MPHLTVRMAATGQDFDEVRALCWDYRSYLVERNSRDRAAIETLYPKAGYAALMDRLEDAHTAPQGVIIVAELDNVIVGCGMSHEIGPGVSEIKRLFVHDRARGHGAGRQICQALIDHARSRGDRLLRLDTLTSLAAARALYADLGFVERGPYSDMPEAALGCVCFYELTL